MTHRISLPALLGSHPLAALASFGLLRAAEKWEPPIKLGFTMEDDWVAFLETERSCSLEEIIVNLEHWIKSDAFARVLGWAPDVRVNPATYRKILGAALAHEDDVLTRFLGAFAADGAVDRQKGLIKPSAFYMVSGQQSFLGGLREILGEVSADAPGIFREAILGPWVYQTELHSLGWDPNTERLHALRSRAPTSEKPSCVAGAVLLALWALPLFPAVSGQGRAYTTGFTRKFGAQYFSWPVFTTPIDILELTSVLQVGEEGWSAKGSHRPGINAIFRARRSEFGQGYAVFRNAELVSRSADPAIGRNGHTAKR